MTAERGAGAGEDRPVPRWPARDPSGALDLSGAPRRFHVVGVGGAGMSALASILLALGHGVSGSDQRASATLARLAAEGAVVHVGHEAAHLVGAEAVTFSTAIKESNPELVEARRSGLPAYTRAELMQAVCRLKRTIAVSGTHGKTTTTAMLAGVMEATGGDPSYIVGGDLVRPCSSGEAGTREGGARWGTGTWLVVEADESDGTFLELPAEIVVVTSVAPDHLDYYRTERRLRAAFSRFLTQAPGTKVVCADDPGAASLVRELAGLREEGGLLTYGSAPWADLRITGVRFEGTSAGFDLGAPGGSLGRFQLPVPGMHNVLDAAAAVAAGMAAGATADQARAALSAYRGVRRRFELRGGRDGVSFVDDYAHNPGKVKALIEAARGTGLGRVVAVFQPHRYSRTEALWRELGEALSAADEVVVTEIYGAGEMPVDGVSGELVAEAARRARPGLPVAYVPGQRHDLLRLLRGLLRPGDLCLSIGAGDITTLADEMLALPEASLPDEHEEGAP